MKRCFKAFMASALVAVMTLSMVLSGLVGMDSVKAASKFYDFDATKLTAKADKEEIPEGTTYADGYFKVVGAVTLRTNSDGSVKAIELAKDMTGGIEFTTADIANAKFSVSSNGSSNTSAVALIDMATGSIVANKDNIETVSTTSATILTYNSLPVGTYKLVSPDHAEYDRGVRVFAIEVEETGAPAGPRAEWTGVANPAISSLVQDGSKVTVTVSMEMGYDGADDLSVGMYDSDKNLLSSVAAEKGEGGYVASFEPTASGTYSYVATAKRDKEADAKDSAEQTFAYVLPLASPAIMSATNKGEGAIELVWNSVKEATGYDLLVNGEKVQDLTTTKATLDNLTVGEEYTFAVAAKRGTESVESDAVVVEITKEAQVGWGFTRYGSSTNKNNNGYEGNANDGKVTVYSESGKGKIVPGSTDGVAFYYTTVPTSMNFTLKATVHVDSWTLSNGQEGFGLLATDRLGEIGTTTATWNNQFMLVAGTKMEYYWNSDLDAVSTSGTKYTMKGGVGSIIKLGLTKDNLAAFEDNDTDTINKFFSTESSTFETTAHDKSQKAGTYNIVGNATKEVEGTLEQYTDFIFEIQKNNTGYFLTYYDMDGTVITKQKTYDTEALSQLDSENVYVGFFASRNARATFTDIEFSTIEPSLDAPKEERPITYVKPKIEIASAKVANKDDYTFALASNVNGTVNVSLNGTNVISNASVIADVKFTGNIKLATELTNELKVEFTPDKDYVPGEYMALANTDTITSNMTISRNLVFNNHVNLYVSPTGNQYGLGTKDSPIDIYTAVNSACPGQTIILMEGEYLLEKTVRVERGMDGTAEKPIRLIADPDSKTRPVLNFQGMCAGMVIGGNYWTISGFDVTNSQNAQKGIQISGSNNTLDNVMAYHNGNTGIQISRLYSSDKFEEWPANNLILNCTSYGNADAGYEDADGFAAKLTVGEGNVFDGCIAYNNADDGWDLFAKVETGSIGAVTIQNCIAYGNGYLEDGTNAGNGNGFKMGGDSLSGHHKISNSFAFFNKAKGFDSNSCPDIQITNCTAYNNESYNVALYTNNAKNTAFAATGIVSIKDSSCKSGAGTGEQLKPVGTQVVEDYLNATNYFWDGSSSLNSDGEEANVKWFESLTFEGIKRTSLGTIDMGSFLKLTDKATEGVGAKLGTKTSKKPKLEAEVVAFPTTGSCVDTEGIVSGYLKIDCQVGDYIPGSVFADCITNKKSLTFNAYNGETLVGTYKVSAKSELPADGFLVLEESVLTAPGAKDDANGDATDVTETTPALGAEVETQSSSSPVVIIIIIVAVVAVIAVVAVVVAKKKKK